MTGVDPVSSNDCRRTTRQRMRVAYFLPPSENFAGVERVVHQLSASLALMDAPGLEVHLIFSTAYSDNSLVNPPYISHTLGSQRLRSLGAQLRRCVYDNRIDLLICPQIEPSVVAFLATRGLGLYGFVTHLHGNPSIERTRSVRSRILHQVFRFVVAPRLSAIFAVSPSLAAYAEKKFSQQKIPVQFLPNPVRLITSSSEVSARGRRAGEFLFVCVARLCEQKGQDILLKAFKLAIESGLIKARVVLVGDGPDRIRLEELAEVLGVRELVDFVGYVADPTEYLVEADCFVLASRWEGFGVALIEALRVGLPIVASDCDFGPRDIVTDEHIGQLVDVGDAEGFARALISARNSTTSTDQVEARRMLASTFDSEKAAAVHLAALRSLWVE